MEKQVTENAYAKINWYLAVGEKRADGYHDILSLMQTVSLADTVIVSLDETPGIRLSCTGHFSIPTDRHNLAWIAAERYFARIGRSPSVTIRIEKKIPVAGGLAGGSADAAAVLRAINRLFDNVLPQKELLRVAAEVGSDVPFCVVGGLAVARGRGELLTPLDFSPQYHLVIINEGEAVSTAKAYADLDGRGGAPALGECDELLSFLRAGRMPSDHRMLRNDFADTVLPQCPKATKALLRLGELGGVAQMSGSGSTVFAVFQSETEARIAADAIAGNALYATTM